MIKDGLDTYLLMLFHQNIYNYSIIKPRSPCLGSDMQCAGKDMLSMYLKHLQLSYLIHMCSHNNNVCYENITE